MANRFARRGLAVDQQEALVIKHSVIPKLLSVVVEDAHNVLLRLELASRFSLLEESSEIGFGESVQPGLTNQRNDLSYLARPYIRTCAQNGEVAIPGRPVFLSVGIFEFRIKWDKLLRPDSNRANEIHPGVREVALHQIGEMGLDSRMRSPVLPARFGNPKHVQRVKFQEAGVPHDCGIGQAAGRSMSSDIKHMGRMKSCAVEQVHPASPYIVVLQG